MTSFIRNLLLSNFIVIFCTPMMLSQSSVRLVTELSPGPDYGLTDEAFILGTVNNSIIIEDRGDIIVSNGLEDGTMIIGNLGNDPFIGHHRVVFEDKYYFMLDNNSLMEIDVSTFSMREVFSDIQVSNFLVYQDKLYLHIGDNSMGESDGLFTLNPSTEELEKIYDVNGFGGIRDIVEHQGLIYTIHWSEETDGAYLASTDGTPGNLNEFYYFYDGSDFSQSRTINMTSAGENLFFWFSNGTENYVLYVSDGTAAGTMELKTDFDVIPFFDFDARRAIGTIGNSIFFRAQEQVGFQTDLWMSDGTVAGTQNFQFIENDDVKPLYFTNYNDKLYFYGAYDSFFDDINGLLVTDGTAGGTQIAMDASAHPESLSREGFNVISHLDKLYFAAYSMSNGSELFESDGTVENTIRLSDIAPGDADGYTHEYRSAGDNLFFFGVTDETGRELYVYGPTSLNTNDITIEEISIFPNPVQDYIFLPTDSEKMKTLKISDSSGRVVYSSKDIQSERIDISNLVPGLYYLVMNSNHSEYKGSFVKL